jgi:hypothetical protein
MSVILLAGAYSNQSSLDKEDVLAYAVDAVSGEWYTAEDFFTDTKNVSCVCPTCHAAVVYCQSQKRRRAQSGFLVDVRPHFEHLLPTDNVCASGEGLHHRYAVWLLYRALSTFTFWDQCPGCHTLREFDTGRGLPGSMVEECVQVGSHQIDLVVMSPEGTTLSAIDMYMTEDKMRYLNDHGIPGIGLVADEVIRASKYGLQITIRRSPLHACSTCYIKQKHKQERMCAERDRQERIHALQWNEKKQSAEHLQGLNEHAATYTDMMREVEDVIIQQKRLQVCLARCTVQDLQAHTTLIRSVLDSINTLPAELHPTPPLEVLLHSITSPDVSMILPKGKYRGSTVDELYNAKEDEEKRGYVVWLAGYKRNGDCYQNVSHRPGQALVERARQLLMGKCYRCDVTGLARDSILCRTCRVGCSTSALFTERSPTPSLEGPTQPHSQTDASPILYGGKYKGQAVDELYSCKEDQEKRGYVAWLAGYNRDGSPIQSPMLRWKKATERAKQLIVGKCYKCDVVVLQENNVLCNTCRVSH